MTAYTTIDAMIERLATFSDELEALVATLDDTVLHTESIPGEWTVAQNIHHLADSHCHSFIRMKFIITEDHPTLQPYNQEVWARTPDYKASIDSSLFILRGLHDRWAVLLRSLTPHQLTRTAYHPENGEQVLSDLILYYANHCNAHLDQIKRTLAAIPA